jgi:aspartyl-tRNA(Asn)/glutamyl-tRNA(Gln) amidotransferase subunit C
MISKQDVQHIAKLARLGLTEDEIKKFQKDLSSILDYFKSLKEIDVSKIEPTFHPAEHFFKRRLRTMREDKAEAQSVKVVNKLVEAAPEKRKRHIKVKAIF